MKKSGVFLAAVAVFMFLLTGAAFAAVEFKFAHSGSLEHQYQIGAEQFKKLVEEKSGGEMKVNLFRRLSSAARGTWPKESAWAPSK